MTERWIRGEESQITMGELEVLCKIRFRVMARDLPLAKELLELPAAHLRQDSCFPQGEDPAVVERQGEFLAKLSFHLRRRQLDSIQNLGRNLQFQYRHLDHLALKSITQWTKLRRGYYADRPRYALSFGATLRRTRAPWAAHRVAVSSSTRKRGSRPSRTAMGWPSR